MKKLNLKWTNGSAPDIDDHNLQLMTDGINDLVDETENIENRLSEIQSSVVVANPTGKPKKVLETIAIDGTVYKVEGGESEKYEVLKLQNGNTPVLVDVPSNTTGIYVAEIREENDKKYYAGSVYIDLDTKMANVCPDEVNLAIYNKYLGQYWEDSNGYIYDLRKVSDVKFEIVYFFDSYTNISAIEFNSEWTKAEMNSGDYGTSALAIAYIKGSGDIGVTSWEDLENKPFESLNADNFEVDENGKLSVIGGGFDGEKNGIEKTQAEYDALKEAGQLERDVNYYITDGKSGGGTINADHVLMTDGKNVEETVNTLKTSLNDKTQQKTYTHHTNYGDLTFRRFGKVVSVFGQLTAMGSDTTINLGDITDTSFKNNYNYAILCGRDFQAPYNDVASVWITTGGNISVYKKSSTPSIYVSGSYVISG